jgi:hypothetical protein
MRFLTYATLGAIATRAEHIARGARRALKTRKSLFDR